MYRVIKYFTDLQDKNRPYNVGDIFPREGKEVTEERIAEMLSSNNKLGAPVIEWVDEPVKKTRKTAKKK